MTRPGIENLSPGHWQTLYLLDHWTIYVYPHKWRRVFSDQREELFSQVCLFQNNRNSLRTIHLQLTLVGINILPGTITNSFFLT